MKFLYIVFFFLIFAKSLTAQFESVNSVSRGGSLMTENNIGGALINPASINAIESSEVYILTRNRYLIKGLNSIAGIIGTKTTYGNFALNASYEGPSFFTSQSIGLTYGHNLGEKVSFGLRASHMTNVIEEVGKQQQWIFEGGILAEVSDKMNLGFSIYNFSGLKAIDDKQVTEDAVIRLGVGYEVSEKTVLNSTIEKGLDNNPNLHLGFQHNISEAIFLRTGVSTSPSVLSFGVGFALQPLMLDIAYSYHRFLGHSPHLAIRYVFKD